MAPVDVQLPMFDNPTSPPFPYYYEEEKDSRMRCCVAALVVALFVPVVVIIFLVLKLVQLSQEYSLVQH